VFFLRRETQQSTRLAQFIQNYREIQILHARYSEPFCPWMIPVENAISLLFIWFCNFCTVELHGLVALKDYLAFPLLSVTITIYQVVYTPMAGSLAELSGGIQKRGATSGFKYRFYQSCAPIRVFVGSFYSYRKNTVVKVMGAIIKGTSRTIILAGGRIH